MCVIPLFVFRYLFKITFQKKRNFLFVYYKYGKSKDYKMVRLGLEERPRR